MFYKVMEFRASYTIDAKNFYMDQHNQSVLTVYGPLFDQVSRSIESMGKNLADLYGNQSEKQELRSWQYAVGSAHETVFFLSLLPPPFSNRLCIDCKKLFVEMRDTVKDKASKLLCKFGASETILSQEITKQCNDYEEMLERIKHPEPEIYQTSQQLAVDFAEAAILYITTRCTPKDRERDGKRIANIMTHVTCIAANIVEGWGRYGFSQTLSFCANSRTGLLKLLFECHDFAPPFSTRLYDRAFRFSHALDTFINQVTEQIIKGLVVPIA